MSQECLHADAIADVPPPLDVCETCVEIGATWVHLRQCLTCGRTLCCDDSPNRHMSGHWREIGHPLMRGASPGEQWVWCFADDSMVRRTPVGWEQYDPFVEGGTDVARAFLGAGGSLDVDDDFVTDHGFPIGQWLGYVRELRSTGWLDARDAEQIEALPGWHW
jgi:hypothetical protein